LLLALLKPIVKVPKIVVTFLTLLKLVKFAKAIIVLCKVDCSIVLLFQRPIGVECGLIEGTIGV
jgi:hypothetical protein